MKKEDRNIYIKNTPIEEAQEIFFNRLGFKNKHEKIDVLDTIGRITFNAIYAKNSSPHYNAAAMDGILVKAESTYEASEVNPIILKEGKGFIYINTGNLIQDGFDAVIMIEDVIELEEGKVKILKAAYPWQHIRPIGEDIVATEMILPSKHKIRPIDLSALLSGGIEEIEVYKKPQIGIIPTGSEIIENNRDLKPGKIIDSNSRVFQGLIEEYGAIANRYSPVADQYNLLKNAISKGIENNDILIINAGSSAGTKDYTAKIIKELGEVIVHGIAIKPGKPTILGIINEKPVIGLPGYPVSSYLAFESFVKPLIYRYTGQILYNEDLLSATLSKRIVSSVKNKELVRVNVGYVNDKYIATPISSGAGVTMSLVKADGILEVPQNSEGLEAGSKVNIKLLKPLNKIKNTMVSIGSHDLIMDIIGDLMPLSSGHVGSMGGIMAMLRGECHIAPIHLLDPISGKYNISYIKKYFRGNKMALIKGVKRYQGFIIKKGNPQNIKSFEDLVNEDVIYINRQRGAGTRVLLDYELNNRKIKSSDIKGYEREMSTHMSVAMAVKSGLATTGLGIMSAAKAMDLDFIKVAEEEYDFLIPYDNLSDRKTQLFIETIKSQEFINRVNSLDGYKTEGIGQVITIL
ncbi:molybdopterin biosynthesis protein [Sporosalibacterium faouarense]|uniref:molybdopterin biosynthesis protein n=1 Tax=Sporosalibacterium faouarense TaxID=516123 RepID=UPI00192B9473|nr:molybdopterin biosynthesis protein [Sporosalibacterium faouarense]